MEINKLIEKNKEYVNYIYSLDNWYEPFSWEPSFKRSLLTWGQIELVLNLIAEYRKLKNYEEADKLRNKLIEIGHSHFMPRIINVGNLMGHKIPNLIYKVSKEKIELFGIVNMEEKVSSHYFKIDEEIDEREPLANFYYSVNLK